MKGLSKDIYADRDFIHYEVQVHKAFIFTHCFYNYHLKEGEEISYIINDKEVALEVIDTNLWERDGMIRLIREAENRFKLNPRLGWKKDMLKQISENDKSLP